MKLLIEEFIKLFVNILEVCDPSKLVIIVLGDTWSHMY